ncbi:hypothetical protein [Sagittula salina]|uniref:Uncharacterized protein n=1 Tax=Sagittula salina TaxID=2820268 RepID=A0A940MK88_9RHOB|nr:hypothetical protein [Sagittula salina]MBP0480894.1 hypothetical protein [Sagittula salina]
MNTPPSPFPLELLDRCIHAFRAVQQAPIRTSGLLPFWHSILLTTLEFVLAFDIALWEGSAMGDPVVNLMFNIVLSTMIALLYSIPYWSEGLPRLGEVALRTLVFPAAVTALMFLSSIVPPLNGTQARTLFATAPAPLMQIWALAGLWGFVFLWSWLTACITPCLRADARRADAFRVLRRFAWMGWDGARLGWGCLWPSSRWPGGFGGVAPWPVPGIVGI